MLNVWLLSHVKGVWGHVDCMVSGVMYRGFGDMLNVWFLGSCIGCLGSSQLKGVWDHV